MQEDIIREMILTLDSRNRRPKNGTWGNANDIYEQGYLEAIEDLKEIFSKYMLISKCSECEKKIQHVFLGIKTLKT